MSFRPKSDDSIIQPAKPALFMNIVFQGERVCRRYLFVQVCKLKRVSFIHSYLAEQVLCES